MPDTPASNAVQLARFRRDKVAISNGGIQLSNKEQARDGKTISLANIPIKSIKDKKLKGNLRRSEKKYNQAAELAVESQQWLLTEDHGFLEAEGEMEKTFKFTQRDLKQHVDLNTQNKMFNLTLNDFGPYRMDYTRNGRHMLIGGKKGHLATFDWKSGKLGCEFNVGETVRDVQWLHNETLFAVAQKKYTFIYDQTGLEVHCLKNHMEVNQLAFLPYHFLLASVGNSGYLKYQDTSTGQVVAEIKTKLGRCDVMAHNRYNAILHLGHTQGTVSLWSPNVTSPLVKMLCHKGPVNAVAMDRGGYYMATSGLDHQLKIWDIRMFKSVHDYYTPTPASALSISDRGVLAVGFGPHIHVWKDALKTKATSPYMTHIQPSSMITDISFCPFEDVLGYGHSNGISSLVIPGSGEPNFDSLEANPYQTKKQRQESEVHNLLEKIQPEMIALNPNFIGSYQHGHSNFDTTKEEEEKQKLELKYKKRGKSSSMRRYLKRQSNVVDAHKIKLRERLEKEKKEKEIQIKRARGEITQEEWTPLNRFQKRPKT